MSPDEAGFLKAIADNPADETARLVYADWLADRDDPRAAFSRLSADFLRCVRDLADLRRTMPTEWLEVIDPLFNRFHVLLWPNPGEGIEGGAVTALAVASGTVVAAGQALVEVSTDKASMEITAEHAGVIISINVRPGDRIPVGYPLLTYLSLQGATPPTKARTPVPPPPTPTLDLQVPRAPLLAFIQDLERERDAFRAAPSARIDAIVSHLSTAAAIVFGGRALRTAQITAEANRGWGGLSAARLDTRMRNRGYTDEQMSQERLDIHLETLRVLLEWHGQPDGFRELPELPANTPPASE